MSKYDDEIERLYNKANSEINSIISVKFSNPFKFDKARTEYTGKILSATPSFMCVELELPFNNRIKDCIQYSDIYNREVFITKI